MYASSNRATVSGLISVIPSVVASLVPQSSSQNDLFCWSIEDCASELTELSRELLGAGQHPRRPRARMAEGLGVQGRVAGDDELEAPVEIVVQGRGERVPDVELPVQADAEQVRAVPEQERAEVEAQLEAVAVLQLRDLALADVP